VLDAANGASEWSPDDCLNDARSISVLPWRADGPAPAAITLADRLALAMCVAVLPGAKPCQAPCNACRVNSAAVAHELAAILRERHGSSTIADFLEGVGCYTPGAGQTVQEESHG